MKLNNRQRAKLTLDELEKEMEILTKEEMNACKGGAVFFDLSGNYIGRVGSSDIIRIIAPEQRSSLPISGNTNAYSDSYWDNFGFGISDIQNEITKKDVVQNVVNHYGRQIGLNQYIFAKKNICGETYESCQAGFTESGILYYDIDSFTLNKESSIISTLQHEQGHKQGCMDKTATCEIDTIFVQISPPEYSNTDTEYRRYIARSLWENYKEFIENEGGLTGYRGILTEDDAYKICGTTKN